MSKKSLFAVITLSLCLAACSSNTTDTASTTAQGAFLGAGAGAVIGAAANANIAAAAAGGGVIGAILSYFISQQDLMQNEITREGVQIIRVGDSLEMIIPSDSLFTTYSYALKTEQYPLLNEIADVLKEYPNVMVNIAGYTDDVASPTFNNELSLNQARSVAGYLWTQGINSRRMITVGFGSANPISDNSNLATSMDNRRIEITLQTA